MHGTIDGFNYGAVTPVVAYVMACLGSALGLRCTIRSLRTDTSWKPGWLGLGAAAIGSGIWTMHFVAMMGFHVAETPISYDLRRTVLSLVVAIVVVGVGVFIVGYRGATRAALLTAGLTTGLGVAGMHYLGMAGMRMNGRLEYSPVAVALSILIAVVAATAALWAAVSVKGFLPSLGASLVMGVAVTGMHYTGMSGLSVRLHESHGAQALGGQVFAVLDHAAADGRPPGVPAARGRRGECSTRSSSSVRASGRPPPPRRPRRPRPTTGPRASAPRTRARRHTRAHTRGRPRPPRGRRCTRSGRTAGGGPALPGGGRAPGGSGSVFQRGSRAPRRRTTASAPHGAAAAPAPSTRVPRARPSERLRAFGPGERRAGPRRFLRSRRRSPSPRRCARGGGSPRR
ncbi:hypothetical protein SCALM49S_03562 [Streptomyces californicus]